MRRHEACCVRSVTARADPDLAVAPLPGDLRIVQFEQRCVHGKNRGCVETICERDRGMHRRGVGNDFVGIATGDVAELRQCDGFRRRGQV